MIFKISELKNLEQLVEQTVQLNWECAFFLKLSVKICSW